MAKDIKGLVTITLSVIRNQLICIKNCATAKDALNVLNSITKHKYTAPREVNLYKKFNSNEDFAAQLNEFIPIVDALKEIGIAIHHNPSQ